MVSDVCVDRALGIWKHLPYVPIVPMVIPPAFHIPGIEMLLVHKKIANDGGKR